MQGRGVHDALRDFLLESAAFLTDEVRRGAELPFIVEERGARPVLYRYSPLTAEFIALRWSSLVELPTYPAARRALATDAGAYLRVRGMPGDDPEHALRDMLERLYEESTSFEFPEERFEAIWSELENSLTVATLRATVLARVNGVRLHSVRVALDRGLALVTPRDIELPPRAADPVGEVEAELDDDVAGASAVFCLYEADLDADSPLPVAAAHAGFRNVLSALRLAGARGAGLSALAWGRFGRGPWQPLPLAFAPGDPRGERWELSAEEEDALRELLRVVSRSPRNSPVAWALERFEMGCSRSLESEALTDYLLALRALLGDDGPHGVALRVAGLCAAPDRRQETQRRMEQAFALERGFVAGEVDAPSPYALVDEVEEHLRALLRDVLCGYLEPDLRRAADELLLTAAEEPAIEARDLRTAEPAADAPEPDTDTRELEVVSLEAHADREDLDDEDDADSYSAPV